VPALNFFSLPNDHTNGTHYLQNYYSPIGAFADPTTIFVSWPTSVILFLSHPSRSVLVGGCYSLEDDSQDGAEHVDRTRSGSPAFVITLSQARARRSTSL